MAYNCGKIKTGYAGQRYEVQYLTYEDEWKIFGWQNEKTGGLLKSVELWPMAKAGRIVRVNNEIYQEFQQKKK